MSAISYSRHICKCECRILKVGAFLFLMNSLEFIVADTVSQKLRNNNVFTVAKRNVEGQDMLYQSIKLTNGIWILAELKIQPGNPSFTVCHPKFFWVVIVFRG